MPVNQQNFGTNRVNHSNKHQLTFRISALMACSFDEISSFNTAVVSFISKAFCLSRFCSLDHAHIWKCLGIKFKILEKVIIRPNVMTYIRT